MHPIHPMPNQKFNILHTEWSIGWGGQEIRILGEASALIETGHKVQIAANPDSKLFQRAKSSGICVHSIRMHKGFAIGALYKLILLIRKEQIEIIHTHSSVDARLGGIAGRLTGTHIVRSRHLSTPIKPRWISWFLYMRLANHVITSGESIRQAMIQNNKMSPERITSIPAGIDTKQFHPRAPDTMLREELGLSKNHFVVGIVAVLRSWKGHRSLFEGVAIYKETNPNVRLLVLGDGPTHNNLKSLRKELGMERHILMLGHIVDTPRYYSIMDAVILNSYSNEATSQTLPQAMLMEKPVIGTNVGSIPEVVLNNETGILIQPHAPQEIIKALSELDCNQNKRRLLAIHGRAHALQKFTKNTMINNTLNVYNYVIQKTP